MGAAAVGGQARRGRCLFNDSNRSGCNGRHSKYLRQRRCLFNDRLAPNAREHALRCAGFEFLGYASARMKMANKRTRLLSGEARRLTQDRGLSGARRAADLAKASGGGHVNAERSCSGSSRGTSSTSYTHIYKPEATCQTRASPHAPTPQSPPRRARRRAGVVDGTLARASRHRRDAAAKI